MIPAISPEPILSLVVAVARNGVIGREGDLPWRMRDDLKWFKEITTGKPIIMGRTTWDSLGRPLPGRLNIVISRGRPDLPEGVLLANSLDEAILLAGAAEEICVIGGAAIYALALPRAERLYVTQIEAEIDGDTVFELPSRDEWTIKQIRRIDASDRNDYPALIEQWDREAEAEHDAAIHD
ncbi:dihydrofolate reductase [Parvularcula marina]|uniref:dihydrofolate reductase n=1 Tax=Parvularcula marina TaxID=2292771 RepID=UPI00351857DA